MSLSASTIRSEFNRQTKNLQQDLEDLCALVNRFPLNVDDQVLQCIENAQQAFRDCNSNLEDAIAILMNGS